MSSHDAFTPEPASWPAAVARSLIRFAAQRTPRELAARLEEEWLADLNAQPSCVSRLNFALGCCWAAWVITQEYCGASVLTASLTAGRTLTLALQSLLPRHSRTFAFVLCAHVLVLHVFGTYVTFPKHRPVPVTVTLQAGAASSALSAVTAEPPALQEHRPQ